MADWEQIALVFKRKCFVRGRAVEFVKNPRRKSDKHPAFIAISEGCECGAFWEKTSRINTQFLSGKLFGEFVTIFFMDENNWRINAPKSEPKAPDPPRPLPGWAKILGVVADASIAEIKSAFRKLVLIHHPDKGGKQDSFIRVRAAFEEAMKQRL